LKRRDFGTLWTGERVSLFVLKAGDRTVTISDWGATLVSFMVPQAGGMEDLCLGFPSLEGYLRNSPYFGSTVGRYANRLGGASFTVGGERYRVDANDGAACLHGGFRGFHLRLWDAEPIDEQGTVGMRFTLESPDGEGGFPGDLFVATEYRLRSDGELSIRHFASTSAPTPVSLTNHAYWNLGGRGDILDHELELRASRYLELGADRIPTGRILKAEGVFDFSQPRRIGLDVDTVGTAEPRGYDHYFLVDEASAQAESRGNSSAGLVPIAKVHEPGMGRTLHIASTLPGFQFYSGNFLDGISGKPGEPYRARSGFCIEPSLYPDAPNRPEFPPAILEPDASYDYLSTYRLETD
jgi:aldose 1-epimerase